MINKFQVNLRTFSLRSSLSDQINVTNDSDDIKKEKKLDGAFESLTDNK